MAWTQAKMAIGAAAGVLIVTGTATFAVAELRQPETYSWQVANPSFDVLRQTPPQVKIVPTIFEKGGGVGENDKSLGIAQPIAALIRSAYGDSEARTVLPADLPADRYDYIANLPQGSRMALQREIQSQLGVVGRREPRLADVLVMQVKVPGAPGLQPATPPTRTPGAPGARRAMAIGANQYSWSGQPISTVANFIENRTKTPVIDRTGLTNHYDVSLHWVQADPKKPNYPSLKQAVLEQLGIELVPSREVIEMLVVEKAKD